MYDTLKMLLKKDGASLTKPRKIIFDNLQGQKPQNMQQIVNGANGKVDRATVYRTMELFERLGIVQRIAIGWKHKFELSDVFVGHHHHFHCTNCDRTFTLPSNPMLETMIDTMSAKTGYSPRGHQLEIYGLCKKCGNN